MNSQSEPGDQWQRVAAELRAYREAQRQAWGDLDDIQVARYRAGVASPEERAVMEQAMESFPNVRELIEVLERESVFQPGSADATRTSASATISVPIVAEPILARFGFWTRRKWAMAGIGLAATFLVGLLVGRAVYQRPQPPPGPGELLLASLTAVPRDSRAADTARITLDDRGVYRMTGGKVFEVEIRGPRSGVVTIVLFGPGPPAVFPLPGQSEIQIEAFQPRRYGPLDLEEIQTTVLVIVTAAPSAETIRGHLPAEAVKPDQLNLLLGALEQALWEAGHRWATIGRITVESAGAAEEYSEEQRNQLALRAAELNKSAMQPYLEGKFEEAKKLLTRALDINERLYPKEKYPQRHPALATCLNNLGTLLQAQGDYPQAQRYFQQALDMNRALYPKEKYSQGHPELAASLTNLGAVLREQGYYAQARRYLQQALDMDQVLYPKVKFPDGQPLLANTLSNLGLLLQAQRDDPEARRYLQQALDMRQALFPSDKYPQGHPELARSLNNLGVLLREQRNYPEARRYLEQAVAMCQRLYPEDKYPQGHPLLAGSLSNLGLVLEAQGDRPEARRYLEQGLTMYQRPYPKDGMLILEASPVGQ